MHRPMEVELDGFVDRYFNRRLSASLTPLFLRTGLSPNAITVLSMVIGLLAGASFGVGSYAAGVVGALLLQLSAIVDCCDGEVARLTNRQSQFGAQLDIAADNVVHMAVFAGVAWGTYRAQGSVTAWLPLLLGVAAVIGTGCSFWAVTRARALRDQRAWTGPAQAARADFLLKNLASRDYSVVLLVSALVGRLEWFLWMVAIGVNVFWIVMAWVTRPSILVRA